MTRTDDPRPPHQYTDEEMHNVDMAHEHSDANIRMLLAFAATMVVVVGLSAGLMLALFYVFEKQAEARDPQVSPIAAPQGQPPQGPRLLTNEPENLRRFRAEETGKLEGYGWMNQSQGLAHVPIGLAKKMVVQHGLPVRADATHDPAVGTHAPAYGESSGGRTITERGGGGDRGHVQPGPGTPQTPPAGQEIKK